jgi:hypothetical protein
LAVPGYKSGFSEKDFDALKAAIERRRKQKSFTASDVLFDAMSLGVTQDAGDIATALGDLVDLGYLREVEDEDPPRWELVDEG